MAFRSRKVWLSAAGVLALSFGVERSAAAQDVGGDTGGGAAPGGAAPSGGAEPGGGAPGGGGPAAPGGGAPPGGEPGTTTTTVQVAPPTTTSTTTMSTPYGVPSPGTDLEAGLPSSSHARSDTTQGDTFDFGESGGGTTAHGNENGAGVITGKTSRVPQFHEVKRGDTLWDVCAAYFQNPWMWPKIWSYNPQVLNPHWVYPGDQIRLRTDGGAGGGGVEPTQRNSMSLGQGKGGFINRRALVPPNTVFLRDVGYIDDPQSDVWGELVGSREDQLLLGQGNTVYLAMRPGVDLRLGQLLTVFRSIRSVEPVKGARTPPGEMIAFKGTVKVDQWDPSTRVARGRLIESLDAIERGALVGPMGRRFEVVEPRRNDTDVAAHVLSSLHPHVVVGQNQVVFIDKGQNDGLKPGNRLFLVRRGDAWRRSLETSTKMARAGARIDAPEHVSIEYTPLHGDEEKFPEEIYGELRVLSVRKYSALTLVTSAAREIEVGDVAVARKGY